MREEINTRRGSEEAMTGKGLLETVEKSVQPRTVLLIPCDVPLQSPSLPSRRLTPPTPHHSDDKERKTD